jgi:hypothetical protein
MAAGTRPVAGGRDLTILNALCLGKKMPATKRAKSVLGREQRGGKNNLFQALTQAFRKTHSDARPYRKKQTGAARWLAPVFKAWP